MKHLGSFISGFVFLHALVATPLLVECFQADGRYLLEILGCDPCHDTGYGNTVSSRSSSLPLPGIEEPGRGDPCLDLLMHDPGCTRVSSVAPSPLVQTPDPPAACVHAVGELAGVAGTGETDPAPDPSRGAAPRLHITLRI